MKYYLTTVDGKRTLYPWEKDIPKGIEAEEIELPTDKMGLMNLFQEALSEVDELKTQLSLKEIPEANEEWFAGAELKEPAGPSNEDRPLLQSRGVDPHRPSWTIQQLNVMFSSRPEGVQDICYAISKLKPHELAYVAFQVAGQMIKPITITVIEEKSDG